VFILSHLTTMKCSTTEDYRVYIKYLDSLNICYEVDLINYKNSTVI